MIEEQIAKLVATLEVRVGNYYNELRKAERALDKLTSKPLVVKLQLDYSQLQRQLGYVNGQLQKWANQPFRVNVGANFAGGAPIGAGGGMAAAGMMAARASAPMGRWKSDYVPELAVMGSAESVAGRIQKTRAAAQAAQMANLGQAAVGFGNAAMGLPLAMNPWMMGGTMAGAATAGTLGYVAKTGMDREASMATIRRLGGFTPGEMGGLQQSLEQTAYNTPGMNFGKVAEVAAFAAKTGVANSPEELAKYTNSLAKMGAVINDVDFESLATEVARVMNLFGLGADKVENFASALYKVDAKSTATAPQILDVMSRLQGFGLAAGMDMPSLMGLSGAIKHVGGRNESATTAMVNLMSRLADPADRKVFESVLGMAPGSINAAFDRGPTEALSLFTGALDKLPAGDEKFNMITGGLGIEGKKVISMLGRVQSKQFGKYAEFERIAREQMANPTALNEGLAAEADTATAAVEELTNAISNLASAMASASGITGTIKGVAGGLGVATNWVSQNRGGVAGLAGVLSGGMMGGAGALFAGPSSAPGTPNPPPSPPPPGGPPGMHWSPWRKEWVGPIDDLFGPPDNSKMFGSSEEYGAGGVLKNFARSMAGSPLAQQLLGFGQDVARGIPGMNPFKGWGGGQAPIDMRPTSSGVSDALSLVTRQQTQLLEGDILRQQLEVQREIRDAVRNGGAGGGAVL